ncbi:LysR family transcriptional regulator [Senegalimassilia anaerobia]
MNIQQLSYFSTAVDTNSFKETARTHFVTPAAISKALRDLETELGIKLFVKEGRAIVPTEKALLLKPLADNISRNVKEFERLAKLPKEENDTP